MAIDDIEVFEKAEGTGDWMLDSGASPHMTHDRNLFTKSERYCIPVRIANGDRTWSEGRGNVSVEINGRDILRVLLCLSIMVSIKEVTPFHTLDSQPLLSIHFSLSWRSSIAIQRLSSFFCAFCPSYFSL